MKVVVTGGTGFLGKRAAVHLAGNGYQVTALGRRESERGFLAKHGIEFIKVDLANSKKLNEVFKEKDAVIHCAALSSVWGHYDDFFRANVTGTQHVVSACLQNKVKRLVHISSPSIYSELKPKLGIKELDPLPPRAINHYAKTKRLAEDIVDQAARNGLETITLRPQAIFGPEDPAIIPRLIRANQKSGIPVFSPEPVLVDITYVENVAFAVWQALQADSIHSGKKYNITNGTPISLLAFLGDVFAKLDIPLRKKAMPFAIASAAASLLEGFHRLFLPQKEPILTKYSLTVLSCSRTLDISAAQKDLDYFPPYSINEGVDCFVKWWKENQR